MAILFSNDLAPKYYIAYNGREDYFTVSWKDGDQWIKKEGAVQLTDVRVRNVRITERAFDGKVNQYFTIAGDMDGERAVITINLMTKHAARVAAMLLSADLSQPLTLACTVTKAGTKFIGSDGKEVTVKEDVKNLSIVQNGHYVRMQETPPPAFVDVEVRIGNKVEKRFEPNPDRMEFVKNSVERINAAISGQRAQRADVGTVDDNFDPFAGAATSKSSAAFDDDDDDDIPF